MTKVCRFVIVIIGLWMQGELFMRKFAIIAFLFLLSMVGGLLLFQWNNYSEQINEQTSEKIAVDQHIIVESKTNKLQVKQTVDGLSPEHSYQLIIPDNISEWTCTTDDNKSCQIEKNQLTVEQNDRTVTFSYFIPFKKESESLLLDHWAISMQQVAFKNTKVEVVESVRRAGSWIAGAPLVGFEKFDFIDYFVFEGENGLFPLYWQSKRLTSIHHQDEFNLFMKEGSTYSLNTSCDFLSKLPNFPYTTVVVTDTHAPVRKKGLMITNKPPMGIELDRQLALQYYLQRSTVKYDDWLYDLLVAHLIGVDVESKKGKQVMQELNDSLSASERQTLFEHITLDNSSYSIEEMDEVLSKIKGLPTTFFKQNMDHVDTVPLYFVDSKKVSINNKQMDLDVIIRNKTRFFPFIETMKGLGFEVEHLSEQILLNKEKMSMRFFIDKNIFILNEEDYGLLEKPLVDINGEIYIEQKWLRTIFDVNMNEEGNLIRIEMEKTINHS